MFGAVLCAIDSSISLIDVRAWGVGVGEKEITGASMIVIFAMNICSAVMYTH